MLVKKYYLSPIEKEHLFGLWCDKRHIKRFLLDLDDTICSTRQLFSSYMSQMYDFLAVKSPILSREAWEETTEIVNKRLFEKFGVTPLRLDYVMDELAEDNSLSVEIREDAKQILRQIYTTPPKMLGGAKTGLRFLHKVGVPVGIVTHANSEWTRKKYNWLGLKRFIGWDDIYIVDENGHKTSDSWKQAAHYFGLELRQCAVVGDSLIFDIDPARKAGAKHCFLVEDPNTESTHQKLVDSNTIKRLSQLAEVGLEEFAGVRSKIKLK